MRRFMIRNCIALVFVAAAVAVLPVGFLPARAGWMAFPAAILFVVCAMCAGKSWVNGRALRDTAKLIAASGASTLMIYGIAMSSMGNLQSLSMYGLAMSEYSALTTGHPCAIASGDAQLISSTWVRDHGIGMELQNLATQKLGCSISMSARLPHRQRAALTVPQAVAINWTRAILGMSA